MLLQTHKVSSCKFKKPVEEEPLLLMLCRVSCVITDQMQLEGAEKDTEIVLNAAVGCEEQLLS